MKERQFCFYTKNYAKGTAEVYGPTLALATKCAEALGGEDITPVSSCDNTVAFSIPKQNAGQ